MAKTQSQATRRARHDANRRAANEGGKSSGGNVTQRVVSENNSDSTKEHGLAGPNARQHPGATSGEGTRPANSTRTQSVARPGFTSDQDRAASERRLPAANANPRPAATSRSEFAGDPERSDPRTPARIRVRAREMGYYGNERRRPGDVFIITHEEDFSDRWMERVGGSTPLRTTTIKEAQANERQAIRDLKFGAGKTGNEPMALSDAQRAQQGVQTGERDDLGGEEVEPGIDNPLDA